MPSLTDNDIESLNEISKRERYVLFFMIFLIAFLSLIAFRTTYLQLVMNNDPVIIPMIDYAIPVAFLFKVVQWLVVLAHLYILIELYIIVEKLKLFEETFTGPRKLKLIRYSKNSLLVFLFLSFERNKWGRLILLVLISFILFLPTFFLGFLLRHYYPFLNYSDLPTILWTVAFLVDIILVTVFWFYFHNNIVDEPHYFSIPIFTDEDLLGFFPFWPRPVIKDITLTSFSTMTGIIIFLFLISIEGMLLYSAFFGSFGMSFNNSELKEIEFKGKDLTSATFQGMLLSHIKFDNAILKHASFRDSKFNRVSFKHSNLNYVTFDNVVGMDEIIKFNTVKSSSYMEISDLEFRGVDLSGMDFSGSEFENVSFINSNLKGTKFHNVLFDGVSFTQNRNLNSNQICQARSIDSLSQTNLSYQLFDSVYQRCPKIFSNPKG